MAALITQRYAELVQQQLVFPLDPSTPNTPENQLDAIVNHFRGLSVQYQRLDTRFRQSEQVVGMLSVSNGKLTERLQKLQTTPPPCQAWDWRRVSRRMRSLQRRNKMSYELARTYAELFDQDPGWITRPPLPESVSGDPHAGRDCTREPIAPDEMDAAWLQRLRVGYPPGLVPPEVLPAEAPEVRERRLP